MGKLIFISLAIFSFSSMAELRPMSDEQLSGVYAEVNTLEEIDDVRDELVEDFLEKMLYQKETDNLDVRISNVISQQLNEEIETIPAKIVPIHEFLSYLRYITSLFGVRLGDITINGVNYGDLKLIEDGHLRYLPSEIDLLEIDTFYLGMGENSIGSIILRDISIKGTVIVNRRGR